MRTYSIRMRASRDGQHISGTDLPRLIDYLENSPIQVNLSALPNESAAPSSTSPTVTSTVVSPVSAEALETSHQESSESLDMLATRGNDERTAQGLVRTLKTFSTAQLPHSTIDGRDYLLYSSSDYSGLSTEKNVVEAAISATRALGTGSGGSRLTTGTSTHHLLETKLAAFFGFDDAVLPATGYQADHSTIGAIAGMFTVASVYSDASRGAISQARQHLFHWRFSLAQPTTPPLSMGAEHRDLLMSGLLSSPMLTTTLAATCSRTRLHATHS